MAMHTSLRESQYGSLGLELMISRKFVQISPSGPRIPSFLMVGMLLKLRMWQSRWQNFRMRLSRPLISQKMSHLGRVFGY
ncbi:hypothetical protein LF63_0113280 [Oleiagrimonas soli]|uniref:Uncharacterized protein n=1 Tax=Oleiagrimonas soli TaxID=1543381 RepID=A0A099CTD6_9GAMM|nr:hypothetical protein LF63_0113280 [Oleiagrimonas soli]